MIAGLSITTFTLVHVVISLIAILSGFVVLKGLLASRHFPGWTALFLAFTAATSLTGFMFPFSGMTPAIATGIVATLVFIPTAAALYLFRLQGAWRWIYTCGAVLSLYLNVFVLIVQSFQKIPTLNVFAPTGSEPPFAITQAIVLVAFVALGLLGVRRFRPGAT
jgi:hypothetical protein